MICNGICMTGYDVGVPYGGIAYPHPECPLHGWDSGLAEGFDEIVPPPKEHPLLAGETRRWACPEHGPMSRWYRDGVLVRIGCEQCPIQPIDLLEDGKIT